MKALWSFCLCLYLMSRDVEGHGRLVDPPSRASAWRYGFNTPVNYDDNQLFCGGKSFQWDEHGGRCGVCGDPFPGPRLHEAGGRYATGTIVKSYTPGQTIDVVIQLTANHKGWFEFRLCPNNNPNRRVTQSCLDRHLLPLASGSGTRVPISSEMTRVQTRLRLPRGLSCSQCVLQWKYNTGNSWGVDPKTGRGCVGCGPQEQFYGCADISITAGSSGTHPLTPHPQPRPVQPWNDHRLRPTGGSSPRDHVRPFPRQRHQAGNAGSSRRCVATGAWSGQASMTRWCRQNCDVGNCPATHCACS